MLITWTLSAQESFAQRPAGNRWTSLQLYESHLLFLSVSTNSIAHIYHINTHHCVELNPESIFTLHTHTCPALSRTRNATRTEIECLGKWCHQVKHKSTCSYQSWTHKQTTLYQHTHTHTPILSHLCADERKSQSPQVIGQDPPVHLSDTGRLTHTTWTQNTRQRVTTAAHTGE